MIIRRFEGDLLLIAQYDHSQLAGRIMTTWRADDFPNRPTRAHVLTATAEHDLGWEPEDSAPSIHPDSGSPYEFVNAPLDVRQGVWPRALQHLAPQDAYAAALVAHHAATVYRRYVGTPEWTTFFPEMERRRDALLATSHVAYDDFLQDYTIVGMGDLWSLVFCNGWHEPHEMNGYRAILRDYASSVGHGSDCVPGGWLEITPDPFAGEAVPFDVRAHRLPARRYASDEDLREAFSRAPIVRLTGVVAGFSPS